MTLSLFAHQSGLAAAAGVTQATACAAPHPNEFSEFKLLYENMDSDGKKCVYILNLKDIL